VKQTALNKEAAALQAELCKWRGMGPVITWTGYAINLASLHETLYEKFMHAMHSVMARYKLSIIR